MTAASRLAAIRGHLDALVGELAAMRDEQALGEWIATRGEALFLEADFATLRTRVEALLAKAVVVDQIDPKATWAETQEFLDKAVAVRKGELFGGAG